MPTLTQRKKRRTKLLRELQKSFGRVEVAKRDLRVAQARTTSLMRSIGRLVKPLRASSNAKARR